MLQGSPNSGPCLTARTNEQDCFENQKRLEIAKQATQGWGNDHENPWGNDCENPQIGLTSGKRSRACTTDGVDGCFSSVKAAFIKRLPFEYDSVLQLEFAGTRRSSRTSPFHL
jgi:hypothetical protein